MTISTAVAIIMSHSVGTVHWQVGVTFGMARLFFTVPNVIDRSPNVLLHDDALL